jgi:hypothetical protein
MLFASILVVLFCMLISCFITTTMTCYASVTRSLPTAHVRVPYRVGMNDGEGETEDEEKTQTCVRGDVMSRERVTEQ